MSIYVLTAGEYSEYHIIACTTDLDRAKELQRFYAEEDPYDAPEIEEYEDAVLQPQKNIKRQHFVFDKSGALKEHEAFVLDEDDRFVKMIAEYYVGPEYDTVDVYTNDPEKAIKIAIDKLAEGRYRTAMKEEAQRRFNEEWAEKHDQIAKLFPTTITTSANFILTMKDPIKEEQ